jgi:hypothetical protein
MSDAEAHDSHLRCAGAAASISEAPYPVNFSNDSAVSLAVYLNSSEEGDGG